MLAPNKVASMVLGREPKVLAIKYRLKGVLTAPRYILTASPGRMKRVRKKKHIKDELLFCF